jgi:hypothetical protein
MDNKTMSLLAARKFRNQSGQTRIAQKWRKNEKASRFIDDAACFL